MNNSDDNIKDLFRSRLSDLEVQPSPETWNRIENHLRRKRTIVTLRYSVAASVLLLIAASILLIRTNQSVLLTSDGLATDTLKPALTQITTVETQPDTIQPDKATKNEVQVSSFAYLVPVQDSIETFTTPNNENETDLAVIPGEKPFAGQLATATAKTVDMPPDTVVAHIEIPQITLNDNFIPNNYFPLSPQEDPQQWIIALAYATNPQLPETEFEQSFGPLRALADLENNFSDFIDNTTSPENIATREHYIPVSFAFTLTRNITPRLNIESGIIFTRLRSVNSTYPLSGGHNAYESTFYYLGFPAGVRFNIVKTGRLSLYMLQSIILEKGVLAQYDTYRFMSGNLIDSESRSGGIDGIQLSTLTAAGLGFRIINPVSVYIQSGFQVFLLNHTQPYTIRNERMIWPSVHTGLRFHL